MKSITINSLLITTVILLILKVFNIINLSWFWVFSPLILPFVVGVIVTGLLFFIAFLIAMSTYNRK